MELREFGWQQSVGMRGGTGCSAGKYHEEVVVYENQGLACFTQKKRFDETKKKLRNLGIDALSRHGCLVRQVKHALHRCNNNINTGG